MDSKNEDCIYTKYGVKIPCTNGKPHKYVPQGLERSTWTKKELKEAEDYNNSLK